MLSCKLEEKKIPGCSATTGKYLLKYCENTNSHGSTGITAPDLKYYSNLWEHRVIRLYFFLYFSAAAVIGEGVSCPPPPPPSPHWTALQSLTATSYTQFGVNI